MKNRESSIYLLYAWEPVVMNENRNPSEMRVGCSQERSKCGEARS
jgi:hypothetical protein